MRLLSYLETILYSSTVSLPCDESNLVDGCMPVPSSHPLHDIGDGDPLNSYFDFDDFDPESLRKAEFDLNDFFDRLEDAGLLDRAHHFADDDQIAHDFWLTRNGHGAGFWDGDYADDTDDVGDELSAIAEKFGEQWVGIGEDGKLYLEG